MIETLRILFEGRLAAAKRHMDESTTASQRGASAVEYGLLIAGIAAVIVLAVFFLGGHIKDLFNGTASKICPPDAAGNAVTSCPAA